MKKNNKLKLAGVLLGATLIASTAGVAAEVKSDASMQKPVKVMSDADLAAKKIMKSNDKVAVEAQAKIADKKHAASKWG